MLQPILGNYPYLAEAAALKASYTNKKNWDTRKQEKTKISSIQNGLRSQKSTCLALEYIQTKYDVTPSYCFINLFLTVNHQLFKPKLHIQATVQLMRIRFDVDKEHINMENCGAI